MVSKFLNSMQQATALIRHIQYKLFIEEFIVSSLVAILGIRLFLKLTSYPQLGGLGLHISHMLWGGLLMFIAIVILLTFLNTNVKQIATVIGGLGFGTFIDEIGKFVTSDNNYFYQPTFALIYLIFIILYLVLHFFDKRHEFTKKEYLVNSIELFKDAVINDLDREEQKRAMEYLQKADSDDAIVRTLSDLYRNFAHIKTTTPSLLSRLKKTLHKFYISLIRKKWFKTAIIVFFLFQAIISMIIGGFLLFTRNLSILPALLLSHSFSTESFNTIHLVTTLISLLLILFGITRIYASRLSAYLMFKRSILISILISQVFAFYYDPLNAFATLIFNIVILTALNYMIESEREIQMKKEQKF